MRARQAADVDQTITAEEALWRCGPRATLSHETAARLQGLELVEDDGVQRLTVPRNHSRLRLNGWTIVRADGAEAQREHVDGVPITPALRTAVDLARVLPADRAVAAADSALRRGLVDAAVLGDVLRTAMGPTARRLRDVGALLDPLSESVLESLLRVLLITSGLPAPLSQHEIRTDSGRVMARADFCWPLARLVVEADGYAFHSDRDAYRRDRIRMNELERLGWRVLRFTWEDVMSRQDYVVALVRECLVTPFLAA